MPDISKWNTQNLEQMRSIFSECLSLLILPDISIWDNYDEDELNSLPNYNLLNNFKNFDFEVVDFSHSPENDDIYNDIELIGNLSKKKFFKFFN